MLNQQKRRWAWNRKQIATTTTTTMAVVSKSSARIFFYECRMLFTDGLMRWIWTQILTEIDIYMLKIWLIYILLYYIQTIPVLFFFLSFSLAPSITSARSVCFVVGLPLRQNTFSTTTTECSFFFVCACVCGCSLVSYGPNQEGKKWFQHKRSVWIYLQT